ncbi:phosphatase PAP2 family protein [Candidatus Woesearchaeota archaeon]|nr:MAG: phosphatase PAP2 family protein [Candidatus Woesearchaeota archaeon]
MKKHKILIIFSAVLILSFAVDHAFFELVDLIRNPLFDYFMGWMSYFASTFIVLILLTSFFLIQEKKIRYVMPLWISFFTAGIISLAIKFLVQRPRPFFEVFIPFFSRLPDYSFPSTHTALAFAAIPILDKEYPMFKWFWILFGLLVGFSRIYNGYHYLSDVVAGAVIGLVIGKMYVLLQEKTNIKWKISSQN